MTEEETIKIIIDFIHYIRFNEKPNYTIDYYYKAIEHLYDLYYREKENTKKQDTEINKLKNVIDKIRDITRWLTIIPSRDKEGDYRPIKNTSAQDCYKALVEIKEMMKEDK